LKLVETLPYIGDLETIEIKIKGVTDWTCKSITIVNEYGSYVFTCYTTIKPLKNM